MGISRSPWLIGEPPQLPFLFRSPFLGWSGISLALSHVCFGSKGAYAVQLLSEEPRGRTSTGQSRSLGAGSGQDGFSYSPTPVHFAPLHAFSLTLLWCLCSGAVRAVWKVNWLGNNGGCLFQASAGLWIDRLLDQLPGLDPHVLTKAQSGDRGSAGSAAWLQVACADTKQHS